MKKITALFIILIFCMAGCSTNISDYSYFKSEDGQTALPIDNKNTKLTILAESSIDDINDKYIIGKLREITGINLDVISVNISSLNSKVQTMIASKQLPDIFQNVLSNYEIYELAKNDTIAPIDKYLDILPNYKKLFIDTPENRRMFTEYQQYDGHVYQFKSYGHSRNINHCFMYRKDIFQKNNIKPWTNTEEFIQNLKDLKQIYPDCYPFAVKLQSSLLLYLAPQWGMSNLNYFYNTDSSRWEYSKTSPNMYDMMLFMRRLYKEELIDKNFLVTPSSSWQSKMLTEEKTFVTFDWIDRMDLFNERMNTFNPEYELTIGYPIGTYGKYLAMDRINSGNSMLIKNNENTELSLKFLDFLIGKKGAELTTIGIEGETYIKNEDGSIKYIGFENDKPNIKDLENKYGLFFVGITQRYDPKCVYFDYTPKTDEAQNFVKENDLMAQNYIRMQINENKLETFNQIQDELNLEFGKLLTEFLISHNEPQIIWQRWIEKAKSLNLEIYEYILNEDHQLPVLAL